MYYNYKLKNGLNVILEHTDYVNSVSVGLWIKCGSRDENEKNNGVSHFIEHMLFKGTNKRTSKQIAGDIEDVGGQINAFTGKEATCYYIKILDSHLDLALDVISDMAFNSTFDEKEMEKERTVILEEISMNEDSPEDVVSDLHYEAIWGSDPLARPISGTIETVSNMTKKDMLEYMKKHYTPENGCISICGNFDVEKVKELIESLFGKWECKDNDKHNYSSPHILNSVLYKNKKIEQMHVNLALQGLPIGHKDMYSLVLINNLIGGTTTSHLFQKVREEQGLCYSIYSYLTSYVNTGILNIYAGTNPENAKKLIEIIKREIKSFNISNVTDERLKKAKEQLKGNYILGLESTSNRMFSYGKSVLFLDKVKTPQDVLDEIDRIDRASLERVYNETIKQGIVNGAIVGDNIEFEEIKTILRS